MPSIVLNKTVLEKLVGKKLPLEKLKDRISMLGTDLEEIKGDDIHVEIFPNRPDMLSEQGFARAFASFIGTKTGLAQFTVKKSDYKVVVDSSVSMRPYTVCAVIKNLKLNDERIRELMQVQEKLAVTHGRARRKSAYGIYPLEHINFPITYIAKDPNKVQFQPLGFDKKIIAKQVEELHPKGRDYKYVADGWKKYPFFIDAKDNVLCMLPYTNSHDTGKVEVSTTEVFVECTGVDLHNVQVALNILTTTLADMGGEIYEVTIQYPDQTIKTPALGPREMKLPLEYINTRLGLDLNEKQAIDLLKHMGYGFDTKKKSVLVPAYRADILHDVDLIEDIAIAHGYENFEEIIPNVATIGQEDYFEIFKNKIAQMLVGLGFNETSSYHLIQKEVQTSKVNDSSDVVQVIDAVSEDFNTLRRWIIPSLLDVLQRNKHHEMPQELFEMGTVFSQTKVSAQNETGIEEKQHLAVMICAEKADFTKIKQVFDFLMRMLSLEYKTTTTNCPTFITGRVARGMVDGKEIAFIGELNPEVLANFELEYPAVAFEIDLTTLYSILKKQN